MQKRNTIQRQLVLDAVRTLGNHPTADQVYSRIRLTYPDISMGTVYRNLTVLAEENKICRVPLPNEAERFDHFTEPHYHIKCIKCGTLYDLPEKDAERFGQDIADIPRKLKTPGFKICGCDILFKGICPVCSGA